MPSQITVTNSQDSGAGSLRDALAQNDANGGNSTITFAPGLAGSTISVQSTLAVNNPVTVDGGANNITINGYNAVTEFTVNDTVAGSPVTIQNLTLANGQGFGGSGMTPGAPGGNAAGGVFVQNAAGGITLANDTFRADNAVGGIGYTQGVNGQPGVGGDAGGAVLVQNGALTLRNDSFVNDNAGGGQGGGSGGGAIGGNAAGAVYVESTGSVSGASQLTSTNTGASVGNGGGGQGTGTAFPVSNNGTVTANDTVVCFCSGTLIRVWRGGVAVDVAVEALRPGDLAVTASGRLRPVVWTGHRRLHGGGGALPHGQQPVRIRAGAFGPGLPARDLRLSPGHPVLVGADADGGGGVLVPVMCLVNGTSVARQPVREATYWHVELDGHDILLAEGLAAESYLDTGSRAWFGDAGQGASALLDPDHIASGDMAGMGGRCRPVAVDGPAVDAERQRLDAVFAAALAAQSAWPRADGAAAPAW